MKTDLEKTLEVFCEGSFKNNIMKKMFNRLGKIYYQEKFNEYIKKSYNPQKAENYSLVNTIDYLLKLRDYYSDWKKTTILVNNYLIESN
jgi:hypothetical protein